MRRRVRVSLVLLVGLAMLGAVTAQAQQPVPPGPAAPPGRAPQERQVAGTVSKVDPLEKTVAISSGLFGLLGATVRVADDTQIRVEGKPATLAEIREGAKVRASYEVRDGGNIAKSIEVMRDEASKQPA
jgi:Cu/Ag efflux protein CusF